MPVIVVSIIRAIIVLGVQLGAWALIERYLLPWIEEAVVEIAHLGGGQDKEVYREVLRNEIVKAAIDFGIGVAVLRSRMPVKIADKLGFTTKGWEITKIKAPWVAGLPIIGKSIETLPKQVAAGSGAGEAAASALGITWTGLKWFGNFVGKTLGLTFLGFIAINNAIDFGNWNSGAYQKTFQRIFAKITGGALVPDEDYRKTKTVSPEVFDKVFSAYRLERAQTINDPWKGGKFPFTRDNFIDLVDKVGAQLLLDKGTASTKEVLANTQLLIEFGEAGPVLGPPSPTTPGAAASPKPAGIQVFTGMIAGGLLGSSNEFVARPSDLIETVEALKQSAEVNLGSFLVALPGKLVYELRLVSSVVNRDGTKTLGSRSQVVSSFNRDGTPRYKTVINRFAVLDIYILKRGGTRTKIETINLGPTDAVKLNPTNLQIQAVNATLSQGLITTDIGQIAGIQTTQPISLLPPEATAGPVRFDWPIGTTLSVRWFDRNNNKELTDEGVVSSYGPGAEKQFMRFTGAGGGTWIIYETDLKSAVPKAGFAFLPGAAFLTPVPAPAPAGTTGGPAAPPQTPPASITPAGPSATSYPVATVFTKPPIPPGLFQQNEPYKRTNETTVYIYQNGLMRGVQTQEAFARFYGTTFRAGMDLNTIHQIRPMPDLSPYLVPSYFFEGAFVS